MRHLAKAPRSEAVREHDPSDASRAGGSIDGFTSAPDAVPTQRYRVVGLAGRGGLSEVHLAWDEHLQREVAIKRLTRRDAAERLLVEARVAAKLEHPAIVPVYDVGEDEHGAFYVMRVVRGRSLAAAIREADAVQRLSLVRPLSTVLEAVAFANEQGVLHGDLKPDNVMLGKNGEVLVVDWGLARALGETPTSFTGTPRYASPEQANNQPLTPRSEVWGAGTMLYELLTGAPPYADRDPEAALAAVRAGQAPHFAALAAAPAELAAISRRALSPAAARYASVAAMASDIGRWLDGRAVSAHTYSVVDHLRRLWRGSRGLVVSVGLAVVVLAIVIITSVLNIIAERDQTRAALADANLAAALSAAERNAAPAALRLATASNAAKPSPIARGIVAAFAFAPAATQVATWSLPGCARVRVAVAGGDVVCRRDDVVELWSTQPLKLKWSRALRVTDATLIGRDGDVIVNVDHAHIVRLSRVDGTTTHEHTGLALTRGFVPSARGEVGIGWEHYFAVVFEADRVAQTVGLCERLDNPIAALASSVDDRTVAAVCEDGRIDLVERATNATRSIDTPFAKSAPDASALAFVGDALVVADRRGGLVRLADDGRVIARTDDGPRGIRELLAPPVEDAFGSIAIVADDGALRVWRTRTGEWFEPFTNTGTSGCTLRQYAWRAGPELVAYDGCTLTAWSLTEGMAYVQQARGISALAVTDAVVALGDVEGLVVRDLDSGAIRFARTDLGRMVKSLAVSPDGLTLAVSVASGGVSFVDLVRGDRTTTAEAPDPDQRVVWIDDQRVAALSYRAGLRVIDRRAPAQPTPLFATEHRFVGAAVQHGQVRLLSRDGRVFALLDGHLTQVADVPGATHLVGVEGTWLLARDHALVTFDGAVVLDGDARITALATRDGHLAVGDERGTVALVVHPGMEVAWQLDAHSERVAGLAFTRDALVSVSWDGRLRRYAVDRADNLWVNSASD